MMTNISYRTIQSANSQINIVFSLVQETTFVSDLYNKLRNELLQELVFTQDYTTTYLNVDYRLNNEEADDLRRRSLILLHYADYINDMAIKGDDNGSNSKRLEYALRALCLTLDTSAMCLRRLDY